MTSALTPAGGSHPVVLTALSSTEADDVERLVAVAARADGGHPVSEAALLALRDPASGARHLLLRSDGSGSGGGGGGAGGSGLVGYAQLPAEGGGELLVTPRARRRGAGTALAAAVEHLATSAAPDGRAGEVRVWAHGGTPAAAALARRRGYRSVRQLQHRSRRLGGTSLPPLPALQLPADVHLRAYRVGSDEEPWLALNARAFAHHPEQGRWTAADLAARTTEPWFDPGDLLLAVDARDGRLLASHWTKLHGGTGTGEVYVVAVDPAEQGRGLGSAVVLAGLLHLQRRGAQRVELYVEGDNAAALRVYERLGFGLDEVDVLYARPSGGIGAG